MQPAERHPGNAGSTSATTWTQRFLQPWPMTLFLLGVFAALTRLAGLGRATDNGTPIFDEKHYVPQAWQIARSWHSPWLPGIEDNPGYGLVVHPPLAKQMEALFMLLGGYNAWSWRLASAVAGVIVVLLIAAIARRISGSLVAGVAAGVIAICDGLLLVTARSGMLDQAQVLFVVAAAYFAVRDYQQMQTRMRDAYTAGLVQVHRWGPRLGFRWWRFAVAISLGLALSVKWSGLYYMAVFGLAVVGADYLRRRRFQVRQPLLGTAMLDALPNFVAAVIIPVLTYVFTWRAWFASETGVYRHAVESGRFDETQGWLWSFLPDTLQNFMYYHVSVLGFHSELTNSAGHVHPWESKPWTWLATTRSLLYYSPKDAEGNNLIILLVGTPVVWWVCVPVMVFAVWAWVIRRQTMWAIPVLGFSAGFFPWLTQFDRQMYLFYAANLAPFLAIALGLTVALVWHSRRLSRRTATVLVVGYLTLVVWNFLFFLPMYTAMPLSDLEYQLRLWLPTWS